MKRLPIVITQPTVSFLFTSRSGLDFNQYVTQLIRKVSSYVHILFDDVHDQLLKIVPFLGIQKRSKMAYKKATGHSRKKIWAFPFFYSAHLQLTSR